MSVVTLFYKLFWSSPACRNLFLLSKVELLDSHEVKLDDKNRREVSFPRIILSNFDPDDLNYSKVDLRAAKTDIKSESLIEEKIKFYQPQLIKFLEGAFGVPFKLVVEDVTKKPLRFIWQLIQLGLEDDEKKQEAKAIALLKKYKIVPPHLRTFEDIEVFLKKNFIDKKFKEVLTEEHLRNLMEFLRAIRDIYMSQLYQMMYQSNQIQLQALRDVDGFEDRVKLFEELFETDVLLYPREESFVECTHCDDQIYRGMLQMKLRPQKLKNLKCPACEKQLNYLVPYELNRELFEIINSQDGLLLHAAAQVLDNNGYEYELNQSVLGDIEIDCLAEVGDELWMIEAKMYKLETSDRKLASKITGHANALLKDARRIKDADGQKLRLMLLTNITDAERLEACSSGAPAEVEVLGVDQFKTLIES
jgi:hypothetical protein